MSVTPKSLNKNVISNKDIMNLVRDYLRVIDEDLQKHIVQLGENTVQFKLPQGFDFPGYNKASVQRIIYVSIIKSLEDRKFSCKIDLDKCVLYISWISVMDKRELDELDQYLMSHSL